MQVTMCEPPESFRKIVSSDFFFAKNLLSTYHRCSFTSEADVAESVNCCCSEVKRYVIPSEGLKMTGPLPELVCAHKGLCFGIV